MSLTPAQTDRAATLASWIACARSEGDRGHLDALIGSVAAATSLEDYAKVAGSLPATYDEYLDLHLRRAALLALAYLVLDEDAALLIAVQNVMNEDRVLLEQVNALHGRSCTGAFSDAIYFAAAVKQAIIFGNPFKALLNEWAAADTHTEFIIDVLQGAFDSLGTLPEDLIAAGRTLVATIAEVSDGSTDEDSLEAMLRRVEISAVARWRSCAPASDFATSGELKQWLNACAQQATSNARFVVKDAFTFARPPLEGDEEGQLVITAFGSAHHHYGRDGLPTEVPDICEVPVGRSSEPIPFSPELLPYVYQKMFGVQSHPSLTATYEGSQLTTSTSRHVVFQGDFGVEGVSEHDRPLSSEAGDIYLVGLEGIDGFIPLRVQDSILELEFDDDGSTVQLDVLDESPFVEREVKQAQFNTHWARWIAPDVVLSDAELDAGVEDAETYLRRKILEERNVAR